MRQRDVHPLLSSDIPMLAKLEILLPLLFLLLHLCYYPLISHWVSIRGVDYSDYLVTKFDRMFPAMPLFIIPYTLIALVNPLLAVYAMVRYCGIDLGVFRRAYASMVLMTGLCYVIWLIFPVKNHLRLPSDLPQQNVLVSLAWELHHHIPLWNSFPSYHVALPWLLLRITQSVAKPAAFFVGIMFISIAIATVALKVHYFADVVSAVILSELVFQFCFKPWQRRQRFSRIPSKEVLRFYVIFLAAFGAVGVLCWLGYLL